MPPFLDHQDAEPFPGTLFGGRFPINVWPQPLLWAFEWHNIKKPIRLKRGQPLSYDQFELQEYLNKISAAVHYVNKTFSLFKRAAEVRPS